MHQPVLLQILDNIMLLCLSN